MRFNPTIWQQTYRYFSYSLLRNEQNLYLDIISKKVKQVLRQQRHCFILFVFTVSVFLRFQEGGVCGGTGCCHSCFCPSGGHHCCLGYRTSWQTLEMMSFIQLLRKRCTQEIVACFQDRMGKSIQNCQIYTSTSLTIPFQIWYAHWLRTGLQKQIT